jgi:hypothetical protein
VTLCSLIKLKSETTTESETSLGQSDARVFWELRKFCDHDRILPWIPLPSYILTWSGYNVRIRYKCILYTV